MGSGTHQNKKTRVNKVTGTCPGMILSEAMYVREIEEPPVVATRKVLNDSRIITYYQKTNKKKRKEKKLKVNTELVWVKMHAWVHYRNEILE